MKINKKKVLVALSGGVDSSVAAYLLKKKGYELIGVHLKLWNDPLNSDSNENKCCSIESLEHARELAQKLKIPFYVINFRDQFKKDIVDYYLNGFKKGETPNPCIECNRCIKFGALLKKMKELKADYLATGHYARKKIVKKDKKVLYELYKAKDQEKDQTYFLYTLSQEKLKHILFPIGDYKKSYVKKLAEKTGLKYLKSKKESQDICFFPEKSQNKFLERYLDKKYLKKGEIRTIDGHLAGTHSGLPFYTIGQRKGLNLGGLKTPLYVTGSNSKTNSLIVGEDKDLYKNKLTAQNLNFINGEIPKTPLLINAKIRSRSKAVPAKIQKITNGKAEIIFSSKVRAITFGQSVVFYNKDEKVVGGGIISA